MASRGLSLAAFLCASIGVRLFVPETTLLVAPAKYIVDAIEALLFANLLLTLRFDKSDGFAFCRARTLHQRLAGFSYTLYASHFPIAIFVWCACAFLFGDAWRRAVGSAAYYPISVTIAVAVLAISYAVSRISEAHTDAVRAWLEAVLSFREPPTRKLAIMCEAEATSPTVIRPD